MRSYVLCLAALFVLAAVLARPGLADEKKPESDEKFTIKSRAFAPKGQSFQVNEKEKTVTTIKVIDDGGNVVMDMKENKSKLRAYVEKTLDVDEKANKRKKYQRAYQKAREVKDDESENKPYHNATVVFEKSDGKWKLRTEGKPELKDSDLKDLVEEANKDAGKDDKFEETLYPKKAVKVGDTWKLDAKEVAKAFDDPDLKVDADTVKAEGKLVKAYKKGKQQWGTLEYAISFDADVGEIKKARCTMKMTIDQAIDDSTHAGKASFTFALAGKQTVEQNCKKLTVDLVVKVEASAEATEAK